jgi:hypothetical protein
MCTHGRAGLASKPSQELHETFHHNAMMNKNIILALEADAVGHQHMHTGPGTEPRTAMWQEDVLNFWLHDPTGQQEEAGCTPMLQDIEQLEQLLI